MSRGITPLPRVPYRIYRTTCLRDYLGFVVNLFLRWSFHHAQPYTLCETSELD